MAKDVITRFKLETTGFDSKIKQAAKELSDYSKTATQAKGGFNQFTKANVDAARALGTMATNTTNAKDRAKELVGAFNDAAKAYNSLTKEQQQSDWAKALAGSLTQLQQRIKETKAEMQGLGGGMKDTGGLFSGDKLSGMLQVFGGNLMTKGLELATSAVSSLASEIGGMITQGVELAKQGEGIRIAFDRLGRGDILDGLRQATHGTVTDLELMKAAVKFNDFRLPVEELGTMLAFAQQKAKDTGQSVDYMVDSIVTGLGRKSLMILDNLGLSAAEIKEKMKQTGDMTKAVGQIIREQMDKAGDYVETAADRAAQANVSLQNKMEELGRKFAPIEEASNQLWTSMKIGILDIIGGPLATLLNSLTEAGRQINTLNRMQGGGKGKPTRTEREIEQFRNSTNQNATYNNIRSGYDIDIISRRAALKRNEQDYKDNLKAAGRDTMAQRGALEQYNTTKARLEREITSLETMKADVTATMKEMMKPVNVNVNTKQAEQNVASLRRQLKELEAQRKKAVKAGDQEQVENLTKQISQVKTNIGYLDPKANKTGSSTKTSKTTDQIIREQFAEQQRDSLAYSSSYKSTAVDQPSDAWRAFTESQTQISKSIEDALQALNKKEGISPKGRPKDTQNVSGTEQFKKTMGDISQLTGGVTSIVSGIQQLGVEIPEEMSKVLGAINVISGILTTIASLATIMTATSTAKATPLIGWLLAGGGIVHAAGGYSVPGNHYSGDNVPALLNSGELVLNRAQQFNLASQLQGGGMQGLNLTATIRGEQIRLALNNNGRRTGRGEYVQSNKR